MVEISVYLHIPFCVRRCGYCDFNTYADMTPFMTSYIHALCQEVKIVAESAPEDLIVKTIYFGGGTPSLVMIDQLEMVLNTLQKNMKVNQNAEISLEANPGTLTRDYLQSLHQLGFNRLSLGMQSADLSDLRVLDRQHHPQEVGKAIAWSRAVGFSNLNLDLIFGIPGQSRNSWQKSLEVALSYDAEHYSLYSLSVERGTPLEAAIEAGKIHPPDDEVVAEMYEDAMDILQARAFIQYEISNWSKSEDKRCQHNLQYWRYLPWLGFGAGAHGNYKMTRTENLPEIHAYIQAVKKSEPGSFPSGPALMNRVSLNQWECIKENMMMSLRLTDEGIYLDDFEQRYKVKLLELFPSQVELLSKNGLLDLDLETQRVRLTRRGRMIGNQVFSRFLNARLPKGFESQLT